MQRTDANVYHFPTDNSSDTFDMGGGVCANFNSSYFLLNSLLITIRLQLITSTPDESIKIYIRFVQPNSYLCPT